MLFLQFNHFDKDSIEEYESRASYLLNVAQQYELNNPEFAVNLRKFRDEKIERINELIHEILEEVSELENYTAHVER
jgi:hypothetical protein